MVAIILSLSLLINPIQQEEEVWFVWLDTPATVDGQKVRLVGKSFFPITCCVKSGKFSKLEKSALTWVQKNYDGTIQTPVLKKIQDEALAMEVVKGAQEAASKDDSIHLVDYSESCK
jgi:hypothetical protein